MNDQKSNGINSTGSPPSPVAPCSAANMVCENCMNWEQPEPLNMRRGWGYCVVFDKQTKAKYGSQCTAFDPWVSWRIGRDGQAHAIVGCDPNASGWLSQCGKFITGPVATNEAQCSECVQR